MRWKIESEVKHKGYFLEKGASSWRQEHTHVKEPGEMSLCTRPYIRGNRPSLIETTSGLQPHGIWLISLGPQSHRQRRGGRFGGENGTRPKPPAHTLRGKEEGRKWAPYVLPHMSTWWRRPRDT
jgi:hypothetical protein